ncbi:unnamed protein product [Darwinula stevensoni]|uniref:G kinase-anchoring protein 1 n=1 Tax=Darwinula stevensoni TaxID=69355 RepID=A0A7R9A385_9CRUS|nr:unnamed protein product [Darwinula stevensoni]CAG0880790.1 unnamed protein product [Darwinula stevensoni]
MDTIDDDSEAESDDNAAKKAQLSKQRAEQEKKKARKKKKAQAEKKEKAELQSLAFGIGRGVKAGGENRKAGGTGNDWEKWKEKDQKLADVTFENDMEEAILLSKMDFEQRKLLREAPESPKGKKSSKKKDKPHTLSINEFNQLGAADVKRFCNGEEVTTQVRISESTQDHSKPDKDEFFQQIEEDTRKALRREQILDSCRDQASLSSVQSILVKEELGKKDKELEQCNEEIQRLKEELLAVKKRNKRLCNILAQGEMREKAEILLEMEKVKQVNEELTTQVQELVEQLEQEKSKVHHLTDDLRKAQKMCAELLRVLRAQGPYQ